MLDQQATVLIEIPSTIAQQEIWELEERLRQVAEVGTELREPKDLITPTLLFLHFVAPIMRDVALVGGGIKATYEVAKILHDFLHPTEKEKTSTDGKNKVVIVTKRKRIELYNLSTQEIEKVLKEQ